MLDTDVISEVKRAKPEPRLLRWVDSADQDRLFLSVIAIAELRRGAVLLPVGGRRDALLTWLNVDIVERFSGRLLPIDHATGEIWGELMGRSSLAGRTMPAMDGLVAAAGVRLINPWEDT